MKCQAIYCALIRYITAAVCGRRDTETYLLIYLEGGLELQVVSGGQDEAERGLICPETALTSLHQRQQILFGIIENAITILYVETVPQTGR